jgi:uncharacterized protein
MRFSKFTHIYECVFEDIIYYIIRHSITNKSFFLEEQEFNKLIKNIKEKNVSENYKILEKEHILVNNKYKEEKFVEYLKELYNLNKFKLEIIYLIFNTNCNLKCKYCYVEGSTEDNFVHNSMSEEIFSDLMIYLNKLISYQKKLYPDKKKLTFIYYGSEPLMSKDYFVRSLDKISDICKKNQIIPDFQITTNGILLEESLIKPLKENKVGISISLDGNKFVNDSMRITHDNKGTYDEIVKAIRLLNKNKIQFGISCTISKHNVELLKENVDHFIDLGAKSIGFNILLNQRNDDTPLVSLDKLNDKLLEASKKVKDSGLYEDRIQRKARAFNGQPRFKDCGGVGNQLVFFPNGDIGPCEAYLCNRKSKMGNIKNTKVEDIEENTLIKYWTKRYPLNMKECVYCPALGICGGGCPYNAETISKKDIYQIDKPFCVHTEKALKWLLKESVEEKTGKKDPFIRDISFMYLKNLS